MHSQANRDLKIDAFSWVFWIVLQREMHRKHVDLNSCGASMVSGVIDYYVYIYICYIHTYTREGAISPMNVKQPTASQRFASLRCGSIAL